MKKIFSLVEARDIIISLFVLAVVFSYPGLLSEPGLLLVSLFVIGLGFIGHELSHKFVARRSGFFAEYRMWPQGLVLALIFAIATGGNFVFAAPGAVVFASYLAYKHPGKRDVGSIGLTGPLFNIALLFIFALIPGEIFRFAATVNAWLAIFNLIPIAPLDGEKVLRWDWRIWGSAMGVSVIGFLAMLFVV